MLKRIAALSVAACLCAHAVIDVSADQGTRIRARIRRASSVAGGGGGGSFTETYVIDSPGWIVRGQVFCNPAASNCPATSQLQYGNVLSVGGLPTQTNCQSRWTPLGACRHAAIAFKATGTGNLAVTEIADPGGTPLTPTWPTGSFSFAVSSGPGSGNTYTAQLPSYPGTNCSMSGPLVSRCWVLVTPVTGGSTAHVSMATVLEVTTYGTDGSRVGWGIENIKRSTSTDKMTVTTSAVLNGSSLTNDDNGQKIAQSNWVFHTGQRWNRISSTSGLSIGTMHGGWESFIKARILPRFVDGYSESYPTTCDNYTNFGGGPQDGGGGVCNYQWAFGFVNSHQGDSENTGRDELTPFADYDARYVLTGDNAYRLVGKKTSNQSGGWTMAVDSNGDGQSILRLDSGTNYQDISTYPGSFTGVGWAADACGAAGVNQGGCSDSYTGIGYNTDLEKEHLPESNFFDYLLTVEKFPLDQLRFQASYVAFMPYQGGGGLTEADPYIWAGYSRGRNGTAGCLNDAEMGRSFGRPLRIVSRAAWAMPDTYSSDRDYFKGIINGNLACIATYMDYLDSRTDVNGRGWGSAPYLAVGLGPATPSSDTWQRRRGNSIVSTTAGNPTVFTVKGDDSGAGSGIDDHGMLTGDYVDIAGIATSGATALNGDHRGPITKISATQFSLAINTTASTSGEGTWTTRTGGYFGHWRAAISGWETYWICSSGLWTCSSTALAFPDRLALAVVSMQTCSSYSTAPGPLHNFYPIPGHTRGDNYALYATCAAWQAANEYNSSTGDLFLSQAAYTGSPHRGNDQWNPAAPNDYYTPYATALLAAAADRGVSGAATAYSTIVSATGVLNGLKLRPGFYWGAP